MPHPLETGAPLWEQPGLRTWFPTRFLADFCWVKSEEIVPKWDDPSSGTWVSSISARNLNIEFVAGNRMDFFLYCTRVVHSEDGSKGFHEHGWVLGTFHPWIWTLCVTVELVCRTHDLQQGYINIDACPTFWTLRLVNLVKYLRNLSGYTPISPPTQRSRCILGTFRLVSSVFSNNSRLHVQFLSTAPTTCTYLCDCFSMPHYHIPSMLMISDLRYSKTYIWDISSLIPLYHISKIVFASA